MRVLAMFFSPARYSSLTDSNLQRRPRGGSSARRPPPAHHPAALLEATGELQWPELPPRQQSSEASVPSLSGPPAAAIAVGTWDADITQMQVKVWSTRTDWHASGCRDSDLPVSLESPPASLSLSSPDTLSPTLHLCTQFPKERMPASPDKLLFLPQGLAQMSPPLWSCFFGFIYPRFLTISSWLPLTASTRAQIKPYQTYTGPFEHQANP